MRLSCRQLQFLFAFAVLGCTDSSGPRTVFMDFSLYDISGRPLPTYLVPTPGPTTTIISNRLTLYKDGTAQTTERRVEWDGTDHTVTYQQHYAINGSVIQFAYNCPPGADCIAPPRGTITGNQLSLDVSGGAGSVIYDYRATSQ